MTDTAPRRIVINVDNIKITAKGLLAYLRVINTATGIKIIIEPPLANFILDPLLREDSQ